MKEVKDKLNVGILLPLIMLIIITACSNQKVVVVRDKNGNVEEEYYVDKSHRDVKNGKYMRYYPNGKLMESSTFKEGKQDGKRTLYHENGKLMLEENFKDGEFHGESKSYFDNGGIESEGSYKNNVRTGLWKAYFKEPKNTVSQEFTFKNNMVDGPAKDYYPNGKLNAEGNKIMYGDFEVYDGKVNIYDSTGRLEKTVTYANGRQVMNKDE